MQRNYVLKNTLHNKHSLQNCTNHVTTQQQHMTDSVPLSTSTELQSSDSLAVWVSDSHAEHSHAAWQQQLLLHAHDDAELQHTAHSHHASL